MDEVGVERRLRRLRVKLTLDTANTNYQCLQLAEIRWQRKNTARSGATRNRLLCCSAQIKIDPSLCQLDIVRNDLFQIGTRQPLRRLGLERAVIVDHCSVQAKIN